MSRSGDLLSSELLHITNSSSIWSQSSSGYPPSTTSTQIPSFYTTPTSTHTHTPIPTHTHTSTHTPTHTSTHTSLNFSLNPLAFTSSSSSVFSLSSSAFVSSTHTPSPSNATTIMDFPIVFLIVPVVGIILLMIVLIFCLFIILYYIHYRKSQRRSQEQRSSKHRNRGRRRGLQQEKSKEGKKYDFQNSTAIAVDPVGDTKRYELQLQSPNATDGDSPTHALSPKHNNCISFTLPICSEGQSSVPSRARTASLPKNCRLSSDLVPSVETFQPSKPHPSRSSSVHYPTSRIHHGGQFNTTYDVPRKPPIYNYLAKDKYVEFYPKRPRSSSTGGVPHAYQPSPDDEYYMIPKSILAPEAFHGTYPQHGAGMGPVSVYDVPRETLIQNKNSIFESGIGSKGCYDVPRSVMANIGRQNPHPARKRNFSVPSCRDEILEASMALCYTDSGGAFDVYDYPTHFLEGHDPIPSPSNNYDVPKSLLMTQRPEVAPYTGGAWGLMHAKDSPSQGRDGGVYAVPRSALVTHNKGQNIGPPTAKKPSRKGSMAQSRSFDLSPLVEATRESSSSQRQYPNDVVYDVPPLDEDVVAERESSIAGARDRKVECSKLEQELQNVHLHRAHQQKSKTLPVKKKKVPPPTKRKPKKN